jgi:hypothetical protein
VDLPTYTNIWRIEKRLYKLYDFRLPMPLPINWIAVFAGITIPYIVLLIAIGLPFNHTLVWLYILPPGVLTWLTTRPVLESKRLPELVESQMRYLSEPKTFVRLAPLSEKDQVKLDGRVWHSRPVKEPAAAPAARRVPVRPALPAGRPARGANELGRLSQPLTPGPVLKPTSVFRPDQAAAAQEAAATERSPQVRPARERPGAAPAAPERLRVQERSRGQSRPQGPGSGQSRPWPMPALPSVGPVPAYPAPVPAVPVPASPVPASPVSAAPVPAPSAAPVPAPSAAPVPMPPVVPASAPPAVPVPASVRRTSAPAGRFSPAFLPASPPGWHHGDDETVHAMPDVLPPSARPAPGGAGPSRVEPVSPASLTPSASAMPAPAAPAAAMPAPVPVRGRGRAGGSGASNLEVSHDGPRRPVPPAGPRNAGTPAGGWPVLPLRPPAAAAPQPVRPVRAVPSQPQPQPQEAAPAPASAPAPEQAAAPESSASEQASAQPVRSVSPGAPVPPADPSRGFSPPARPLRPVVRLVPAQTDAPETSDSPEQPAEPQETAATAESDAAPEAEPAKPQADAEPELSAEPATPAEPQTPAEPATPAEPQTPAAPDALADPEPPAVPEPAAAAPTVQQVAEPAQRVQSVERALSGPGRDRNAPWGGKVKVVTGNGAAQGPGARDQEAQDRNRARLPIPEPRRILVLGCTSGAGQSVTTLMTASMLASLREHPVAAVDLHDGTLARYRAPAAWLEELLAGSPPQQIQPARPDGLHPVPKPSPGRLDVVASHEPLRDNDELRLAVQLSRHYPLTVLDPGAAALTRLLKITDQLVVVVPANADAADALADTRDWLDNNGHAELAMQSVTVINGVSRRSLADVEQAEAIARGRSRAIVRVPWDDMLPVAATGPATLRPQTRVAYTALSGVLVAGLSAVPSRKKQS